MWVAVSSRTLESWIKEKEKKGEIGWSTAFILLPLNYRSNVTVWQRLIHLDCYQEERKEEEGEKEKGREVRKKEGGRERDWMDDVCMYVWVDVDDGWMVN